MIQDTSRDSYREVKKTLGKRQSAVLDVIRYLKNPTNSEIARFMGLPISSITPRTNELVNHLFKVVKGERRICHVTGNDAYTWRAI